MSRERLESKVIRKNGAKIADRISAGGSELVQRFATSLAGEAFITSAGQFMVLGVPLFNQVTQMLGAVESKLKTTDTPGETLESFIEILQDNPVLADLADKLIAEYSKYLAILQWGPGRSLAESELQFCFLAHSTNLCLIFSCRGMKLLYSHAPKSNHWCFGAGKLVLKNVVSLSSTESYGGTAFRSSSGTGASGSCSGASTSPNGAAAGGSSSTGADTLLGRLRTIKCLSCRQLLQEVHITALAIANTSLHSSEID